MINFDLTSYDVTLLSSLSFCITIALLVYLFLSIHAEKSVKKYIAQLNISHSNRDLEELYDTNSTRRSYRQVITPPFLLRVLPLGGIDLGFKSKEMRLLFERAGWIYARNGDVYLKILLLIFLVLFFLIFFGMDAISPYKNPFVKVGVWFICVASIGGLYKPMLRKIARDNVKEMEPEFLAFCDILTIALNSGLSLEVAVYHINNSIDVSHQQLKLLLKQLETELEFGEAEVALSNFYNRFHSPLVRDFVVIARQSRKQGSSIVEGLTIIIQEYKRAYLLQMEQQSQTIPLKITFITAIFFLPTFFIFILAPLFIKFL